VTKFRELVQLVKDHDSFEKLYGRMRENFKKASSTSPPRKKQQSARDAGQIKLFGLDCEMIITTDEDGGGDKEYSLARASLVEFLPEVEEFHTRFDVFVKVPEERAVKDLLEHVSGVSEQHLQTASHTLDDVISLLEHHVSHHDILVGHSLWSDFEALKWWHDNFVDTSLFFSVAPAPRMTLGLKDAVIHAVGEMFQTGGAHDPVADAKYALKVAKFLADRPGGPFVELEDVPDRFKKTLTIVNLDASRGDINDILEKIAVDCKATIPKPMKVTTRNGVDYGSITFEFENEQAAVQALQSFPANTEVNGDGGYLDQSGFLKKACAFKQFTPVILCEVISYHRVSLDGEIEWTCQRKRLGKLLGQKGERVLRIQRMTGAQISNKPKDDKHVVFTIRASDRDKCEAALKLLKDENETI